MACYGVATVLDPLLIIIVDLAMHNYDCATYVHNTPTLHFVVTPFTWAEGGCGRSEGAHVC